MCWTWWVRRTAISKLIRQYFTPHGITQQNLSPQIISTKALMQNLGPSTMA